MDSSNTRVLILDIETSYLKVSVWEVGKQYVGIDQVLEDWHIMAWSAKWLGDPASKIIYRETRTKNDKPIIQDLWKLLDEADIVVTQNGKAFDGPKIEARMMIHGMTPPSPYKHFDTFLATKGKAFTSHKLSYLTPTLNDKYTKLEHAKYPGRVLWDECEKGNPDAWKEMKKYNIHDVLSTEELYLRIRPWAPKNMPSPFEAHDKPCCPYCHSYMMRSLGRRKDFRRFLCKLCGKSHQEKAA